MRNEPNTAITPTTVHVRSPHCGWIATSAATQPTKYRIVSSTWYTDGASSLRSLRAIANAAFMNDQPFFQLSMMTMAPPCGSTSMPPGAAGREGRSDRHLARERQRYPFADDGRAHAVPRE